jgi:uncharacterized membrane protein (UPF0136 family)
MKFKEYFVLLFLGIGISYFVSCLQTSPGYMDADYYYANGIQLADGYGFSEPFLWNYLDDPSSLPHPSHTYWMPFVSIITSGSIAIFKNTNFQTARIPFFLFASLIPLITGAFSFTLLKDKKFAFPAGILAALSGFYLPYLNTTDSFGLCMILGTGYLIFFPKNTNLSSRKLFISSFVLGLISGLMHLTRADGILWFFCSILFIAFLYLRSTHSQNSITHLVLAVACIIIGYLTIMGPWMARNLTTFGTFLSPGGLKTLWLRNYEDIFSYPSDHLTFTYLWGSGIKAIIESRLWALGQNIQTVLAVQGSIILAPFVIIGLWSSRKDVRIKAGVFLWAMTFLVMSFVFPFSGARGGFFHSGSALQPLFWSMAPYGLYNALERISKFRKWNINRSYTMFCPGIIFITLALSLFLLIKTSVGNDIQQPLWDKSQRVYREVENKLLTFGAKSDSIVMVNNPPGYYNTNKRPAIIIPNGGTEKIIEVSEKFSADYLLLDKNHIPELEQLYTYPKENPDFEYLFNEQEVIVYRILPRR